MTTKEMHIGIDLALQKVNTNRQRNVLPEEKDWYLNVAMMQFIKTRSTPKSNYKREGFEDSQKRYDDLKELKTEVRRKAYIHDDIEVYTYLPQDYMTLIDSRSYESYHCEGLIRTTSTTTVAFNYFVLPMPTATSVAPYYYGLTIQKNTGTVGVPVWVDLLSVTDSGLPYLRTEEAKFEYIKYFLNNLRTTNIEIYWEEFDTLYARNSFIIVDRQTTTPTSGILQPFVGLRLRYTTSGIGVTPITYSSPSTVLPTAFTVSSYNNAFTNFYTTTNRLYTSESIYMINENVYAGSHHDAPMCYLRGNKIFVLYDDYFTPVDIYIDYLRTPRPIDIRIGQNCELHANTHVEIMNIAIQNITAELNDPVYPNITRENSKME